jgi:type 1 fimbriae regulatory protein FimE
MKCLLRHELDALLAAAKSESMSDYLMFLVTFNHGLRVTEVVGGRDWESGKDHAPLSKANLVGDRIVVSRLKHSMTTTQPLLENERGFLLKIEGPWFPMSRWTFRRRMQHYGAKAGLDLSRCHPHSLKHACGRLAYLGGMGLPELQTYLGHRVGSNTMIYAQASEGEACAAFAAAVGK